MIRLIFAAVFFLSGCSEGSFSGQGEGVANKARNNPEPAKPEPKAEVKEDDSTETETEGDLETDIDQVAKVEKKPIEKVSDDDCTIDRGKLRIIVTFDNSSSNSSDSFAAMRRGVEHFANRLTSFAAETFTPDMRLAIVRMDEPSKNKGAHIGPNRWIAVNEQNTGKIASEIQWGTTKGHNTYFDETFLRAIELLKEDGADVKISNERNFVIFFTDGGAERHNQSGALTTELATTLGAAIYTIGTDGNKGEGFLSQLALPKVGIVSDTHIGRFFATSSGDEVVNSFDDIFTKAATKLCKETSD